MRLVSPETGTGTVIVTVEGLVLNDQPSVIFAPVEWTELQDELQSLVDDGSLSQEQADSLGSRR